MVMMMKPNTFGRAALCAFASASLLGLSACNNTDTTEASGFTSGDPGTESIAALIAENDELSAVEALMEDAGLARAFDGMAAYTVFAPSDDALAALGENFAGDEARPALVAVFREHIVPGYLTGQDFIAAIESSGGPVEMQTMGEGTLTFSMEGETLTVSNGDSSASAVITNEMLGANGVVFPVDAVLKNVGTEG